MFRSTQRIAQLSSHLKVRTPIDKVRNLHILSSSPKMSHLFEDATPAEVKNAKVSTTYEAHGWKISRLIIRDDRVFTWSLWTRQYVIFPESLYPHLYPFMSRKTRVRNLLLPRHVSRLIFHPERAILTPKLRRMAKRSKSCSRSSTKSTALNGRLHSCMDSPSSYPLG